MAQLHLIQNPIKADTFIQKYKLLAGDKDNYLFLNDALWSLLDKAFLEGPKSSLFKQQCCYALKEQCDARNMTHRLAQSVTLIEYGDFVILCQESDKVVSW